MISVCKMINSRNLYIVSVVNNTVLHTVLFNDRSSIKILPRFYNKMGGEHNFPLIVSWVQW